MNYKQKADQINDILYEIRGLYKNYPLLNEMIKRKEQIKREFYKRVNADLYLYGKADLGQITKDLQIKWGSVWKALE